MILALLNQNGGVGKITPAESSKKLNKVAVYVSRCC